MASDTTPGDLAALLARIENLSGGDREVDALVEARFVPGAKMPNVNDRVEVGHYWVPGYLRCAARLTASLDAALTLVERCGRHWSLSDIGGAYYEADIADRPSFTARAKTPALALLAALIRSLQHVE